jgi:hypothetical protein
VPHSLRDTLTIVSWSGKALLCFFHTRLRKSRPCREVMHCGVGRGNAASRAPAVSPASAAPTPCKSTRRTAGGRWEGKQGKPGAEQEGRDTREGVGQRPASHTTCHDEPNAQATALGNSSCHSCLRE